MLGISVVPKWYHQYTIMVPKWYHSGTKMVYNWNRAKRGLLPLKKEEIERGLIFQGNIHVSSPFKRGGTDSDYVQLKSSCNLSQNGFKCDNTRWKRVTHD